MKPHGQVAAMEPVKMASAAAQPPQEPRPQQPKQQQSVSGNRQQQQPSAAAEASSSSSRANAGSRDTQQLPAFLLRPVNLPKAPEKPAGEEKGRRRESYAPALNAFLPSGGQKSAERQLRTDGEFAVRIVRIANRPWRRPPLP